MIVREKGDAFVLISQHNHAAVSGEFAKKWNHSFYEQVGRKDDLLFSVYEHDRGWLALDHTPFWNDAKQAPYSFLDFPTVPKLVHYKHGIDEVEQMNPYAALLCSLHFCALLGEKNDEYQSFLAHEHKRQNKLKNLLHINATVEKKQIFPHLNLLQLCDHLSLYICMNKPGLQRSYEFSHSHFLLDSKGRNIVASWQNMKEMSLIPFPFQVEFEVSIPFKEVKKRDIQNLGLAESYAKAKIQSYNIKIVK